MKSKYVLKNPWFMCGDEMKGVIDWFMIRRFRK